MDQMKNNLSSESKAVRNVIKMLDKGIDDMETGRELPLNEAFQQVKEMRSIRRDARV